MKKSAGWTVALGLIAVSSLGAGSNAKASETIKPANIVFSDDGVTTPLAAKGAAQAGRAVFTDRKLGNCLACHVNPDLVSEMFHGSTGPDLTGVADRYSESELRAIIVNAKKIFDGTLMPGFYVNSGFQRVPDKFAGKTILSAQQVEDVVAYLRTLTDN